VQDLVLTGASVVELKFRGSVAADISELQKARDSASAAKTAAKKAASATTPKPASTAAAAAVDEAEGKVREAEAKAQEAKRRVAAITQAIEGASYKLHTEPRWAYTCERAGWDIKREEAPEVLPGTQPSIAQQGQDGWQGLRRLLLKLDHERCQKSGGKPTDGELTLEQKRFYQKVAEDKAAGIIKKTTHKDNANRDGTDVG